MTKPCDNCGVNIEQAILYDEVICFETCQKWQEWRDNETLAVNHK